jgi:flavodoxin
MKVLVAYYSSDGNTEYIAKRVARTAGGELLKILPEKETKRKGFLRMMWGGRQAMMNKKPALKPFDKDPTSYDVLFIGTPVWAWRHAPPVASFLDQVDLDGKKVAFFATYDGNIGSTFEKMQVAMKGGEVIGKEGFVKVLAETPEKKAADAVRWAKRIMDSLQ